MHPLPSEYVPIEGFPAYGIHPDGRVYSRRQGKLLAQHSPGKHPQVGLVGPQGRKLRYVARLVATAFVPNPHGYADVAYQDQNPANVAASNLSWAADHTQNQRPAQPMKNGRSGLRGVTYVAPRNHYQAYIVRNGVRVYLGTYQSAEAAHDAYKAADKLYRETGNLPPKA